MTSTENSTTATTHTAAHQAQVVTHQLAYATGRTVTLCADCAQAWTGPALGAVAHGAHWGQCQGSAAARFEDVTTGQMHTLTRGMRYIRVSASDVRRGDYESGGETYDGHPDESMVVGADDAFRVGEYILVWDENGDGRGTEATDAMVDPQVYWLSLITSDV